MHIITGLGRCGSSFVASLVHGSGIDMGRFDPDIMAGYEHSDISAHNKSILNGDYWGTESEKTNLLNASLNTIITKDPRFIMTIGVWIDAGAKIDSALLSIRDYEEIIKSSRATYAGNAMPFMFMKKRDCIRILDSLMLGFVNTCIDNNIKMFTLPYPDIINNFSYLNPLANLLSIPKSKLHEVWEEKRKVGGWKK